MAMYSIDALKKGVESVGHGKVIDAMADAFKFYSAGKCTVAPVQHLELAGGGDFCVKSGFFNNGESMVVKVAGGGFPGYGSSGLMTVFNQMTGALDAILIDDGWLTDLRTAAAGSLCVRHYAPTGVAVVGVIGTGIQARFQLDTLREVCACRKVVLYGRSAERARACAEDLVAMGYSVDVVGSVAAVAAKADVLITTTSSKAALLAHADLDVKSGGMLIVAMGSDGVGKQELAADVVAAADLILLDSTPQCTAFGEASHAITVGAVSKDDARLTELGTSLSVGDQFRKGASDGRLIVADLTGVAVQDVAIAQMAMAAVKALPKTSL